MDHAGVGRCRPRVARGHDVDVELRTGRQVLSQQRFDDRNGPFDGLTRREPHREVRTRRRDDDRLLQDRRAAFDPVDVDRGERPGAEIELIGCRLVHGHGALGLEHGGAVGQAAPATGLVVADLDQVGEQRRREPAACGQQAVQRGEEHVECIQRRTAEHARVQVALSGARFEMKVERAARRPVEDRRVGVEHPRVEDHARGGVAGVLVEEVDDRRAADLLFGVAAEADVDRQASFARKVERCP